MKKYAIPQIRLGATSFLTPAAYVPGFRFAAERCDDVSLLVIAPGQHGEHLIHADEVRQIASIADGEGVSVNIHLPAEHNFDTRESARRMVDDVAMVMERVSCLQAHTFVLHINFPRLENRLLGAGLDKPQLSQEQAAYVHEALHELAALMPHPEQLALENLEAFPPSLWDRWLVDTAYSRCADIGHLWKDGWDPLQFLDDWLPRTRLIHLHGLKPRPNEVVPDAVAARELPVTETRRKLQTLFGIYPKDHTSLALMPPELVDGVMHTLWRSSYSGVVNLEMFREEDFIASHAVVMHSWERYETRRAHLA